MFVETPKNFEVTREIDFTLFGMGPKYRRRAERMRPEDRVVFYIKGTRKWPATATIRSTYFEDNSPVWMPNSKNETFQYRVKLEPDIILKEEDYIDAMILGPRLDYVKKWLPENWPLAFLDRLHLLPQRDFRLIEGEMQRTRSKPNKLISPLYTCASGNDRFDYSESPIKLLDEQGLEKNVRTQLCGDMSND